MKNRIKFKYVVSLLAVIIWMIVIFMFSNQNGESSSGLSQKITVQIVNILNNILGNKITNEEMVILVNPIIRKLAHYIIYLIGGILIANFLCVSKKFTDKK